MADLPTRREIQERARDAILTTDGVRISASAADLEGSDVNLILAMIALGGEEVVNRAARALAGNFESTAQGRALDRVIFDRKGLTRIPATPAVGQIQLSRPTAGAGAGTVFGALPGNDPAPTRIQTNQGINYILTQPAIFGAADLGPITVTAQAELVGLDNQVDANQAWTFVDTIFDETIIATNPITMSGAANEETDDRFRGRALNFFPTVRRGTLGAVQFGLESTPGIATASVVEVIQPQNSLPACVLEAFILDALGQANQTLAARGQANLLNFRLAGGAVSVVPGTIQFIDVEFADLEFDTNIVLDTSAAFEDVRTAVIAAINNQRPGQSLLRSTIIAAARSVPGVLIEDSDLTEPVGTLNPATNSVTFRTTRERITSTT